ncbi:MAG: SRPBCC family protein [Hyphomonas sp.]|nr:SRPBCC family protein [Hyphomonas sp.]
MTQQAPLLLTRLTGTVARPIESVFDFVSDHENYQRWYPGVESVTALDDSPPGAIGKAYVEIIRMPGGRLQEIRIETVRSERPVLFVTEGDYAPLLPQMSFELAAAGPDETQITWTFRSRLASPIRRLMARLLFRPILKRQAVVAMANLTRCLEQAAG